MAVSKYIKSPPLNEISICSLFNGDGVDVNIPRIGSPGWKKGTIKFKITWEFCPDEPELEEIADSSNTTNNPEISPLDDILRMMNK